MSQPPLKYLHHRSSLSAAKIEEFRKIDTNSLLESLRPGLPGSLKTRPDGTIVDGHHRICVLRERNVDVDALPREILPAGKDRPS
jgi:hypothetical protein